MAVSILVSAQDDLHSTTGGWIDGQRAFQIDSIFQIITAYNANGVIG